MEKYMPFHIMLKHRDDEEEEEEEESTKRGFNLSFLLSF